MRQFEHPKVQRKYEYYLNSDKVKPFKMKKYTSIHAKAFTSGYFNQGKPENLSEGSQQAAAYYAGKDRRERDKQED